MILRTVTTADYPAISRIALQAYPETQLTAERLNEADRTRARHLKSGGFLATIQGRAVGFVRYTQYADLYEPERVVLAGAVLPEYRKQGVGNGLLEALERHLPGLGVVQLQTQVSATDHATLTFLRRRGFVETWRRLEYRLDTHKADSSSLETLAKRLEQQNIRVKAYLDLAADPDRDEKLRALNWRLEQDVPHGKTPTKLSLDTFLHERLEPEAVLKDAFYVALDGEIFIGMSSLWNFKTHLETEFTGILPEYRGRGVAALMKLLGVRYAQQYSFAEIRTTNDAGNEAMRQLNERLGFMARPALLRLEKRLN